MHKNRFTLRAHRSGSIHRKRSAVVAEEGDDGRLWLSKTPALLKPGESFTSLIPVEASLIRDVIVNTHEELEWSETFYTPAIFRYGTNDVALRFESMRRELEYNVNGIHVIAQGTVMVSEEFAQQLVELLRATTYPRTLYVYLRAVRIAQIGDMMVKPPENVGEPVKAYASVLDAFTLPTELSERAPSVQWVAGYLATMHDNPADQNDLLSLCGLDRTYYIVDASERARDIAYAYMALHGHPERPRNVNTPRLAEDARNLTLRVLHHFRLFMARRPVGRAGR